MASGGYRAGSGRKAMPSAEKRVTMSIVVEPETKQYLKEGARQAGISIGKYIEYILQDHQEMLEEL